MARYTPATLNPPLTRKPEVLAPAGDQDALLAALSSGADAVYFGLSDGFNARARAENFALENLPETVQMIHEAGARAYLTLNTLIFETELERLESLLREVARSGVDAIIVQDPAVALLAGAICPALEIHASTQMTISSPEGARFAESLGVTRVVVPRELSVAEIQDFASRSELELEVFIHGALCMSWSGQCLTSRAWGGRSANRGQCAQSCRLPYDLIVDGEHRDLGDVRYLLSPKDLAGFRAVPGLIEAGVHTLKIEGRQKSASYVATSVHGMRQWVDALASEEGATRDDVREMAQSLLSMQLSYSRGFSDGFLAGSDHQTLVEGRFPKHRGVLLGRVVEVGPDHVIVKRAVEATPESPGVVSSPLPALGGSQEAASGPEVARLEPRPGLGVVFDDGRPESDMEAGGRLTSVERDGDLYTLRFRRPRRKLDPITPGQRVWVTSDPVVERQTARRIKEGVPDKQIPIELEVFGGIGKPLKARARMGRFKAFAQTGSELLYASGDGLGDKLLMAKLGALGGTPFRLERLISSGLELGLYVPTSQLKAVRRELVAPLMTCLEEGDARTIAERPVLPELRGPEPSPLSSDPAIIPLCRNDAQLDAIIAAGFQHVELDWMEMVGLARAVERAREAGLGVTIATVRVQKPGEEGYDRHIRRLAPDGVLVRHWGALMHFAHGNVPEAERPTLHGDFSLNVTNSLTAHHLLRFGLDTLTAAHDLDEVQLMALLERVPTSRVAVTVHHHVPTFHTEHCVYSHNLSNGRDYRSCGRPCDRHQIALRDRHDKEHPVIVDVECRNTVFNAVAQSAPSLVPKLLQRGVRRFRLEFVWETFEEALAVAESYRDLLAGRIEPGEVLRRIGTQEQFGVTQGTMKTFW